MNIVCFHNPDEENGYLSNWYHSDFLMDGIKYTSMEQFMMYKKAIYFQDAKRAEEILAISEPDSAVFPLLCLGAVHHP